MGVWAVLLIYLSQVDLGRVQAQEQGGALMSWTLWRSEEQLSGARNRDPRSADSRSLSVNSTKLLEGTQKYYRWEGYGPADRRTEELWVNLSASQVRIHGILSNAHRQAARVALSFDFPFYGHSIRQVIIATGGFIFMGEVIHQMLTATQYVAPLMANFDPSFSSNSTVRYSDNGNLFVVQWDKVRLKDRESEGAFTFQTVLHRNGTIVFNYRKIPILVEKMNSTDHPVKVGLSDAFLATGITQNTIYEYHRVEIETANIVNGSAVEIVPLPTCSQHTTCDLCMTSNATTGCGWCNTVQRCSDGIDRHRQEWIEFNCPEESKGRCEDYNPVSEETTASHLESSPTAPTTKAARLQDHPSTTDEDDAPGNSGISENTAIIAGVVAALVVVVALTLLAVYYINTHPTVAPPFYLMQRRTNNYWPSMKFRNQGCQSSYAEVELGSHEKEGFIEAEPCF
ncbi:unnamed protein product [Knipowitschia caucasica]|uniref:PSI domain-containing protein n=1 Tax=Knipowitschia caucasica TaxID=637954 RepID=A0AAV2LCA1_KNICA